MQEDRRDGAVMKRRLLTLVLYAYAAVGLLVAAPLLLHLGPASDVVNGTSVRLLGAALAALALGALLVARDPVRNRSLFWVEVVFTALTTLVLLFKVVIHHGHAEFDERNYVVLASATIGLLLLLFLYPYGEKHEAGEERPVPPAKRS